MRPIVRTSALLAAGVVYALTAVSPVGTKHRVLIPADSPIAVEAPFQVDLLDGEGARGIRIPPDVGRGWCNEAKGSASYTFYVPQDGSYVLWAHALWGGACTNAVYVQVDDQPKLTFGNDPAYGAWHWVRGVDYSLARGTHRLTLSNHSDGIAIRQLLWLSDPYEDPGGDHLATYDIFYDGFDGCDGGNVAAWQRSPEGWDIRQPGADTTGNRYLVATSTTSPIFAVVGEDTWDDYAVSLRINPRSAGVVGLAFNWRSQDDYLAVQWRQTDALPATSPRVELIRRRDGLITVLASAPGCLALNAWHDVEASSDQGKLLITVDGRPASALPLPQPLRGKVALLAAGGAQAWFDEVHVRKQGRAAEKAPVAVPSMKGQSCAASNS